MTAKNRNILAKTLVCALLTAATVTAKAKQTIGVTKTQARLIVVGIAASCAAIGVGVYYIVRHNRGLTGGAFSGENGLQLKSQGDEKSYSGSGYFAGNLNVTGNVSKGGGLFKIEPESKGINAPDLPPHIPDSTALENRVAENRKIANGKPR